MTGPEHCIFGAVLSHLGLHQRYGTRVTVVMIVASIVPDIDALTILGGRMAYYQHHRTLMHSFGGAAIASVGLAALCVVFCLLARVAKPNADGRLGQLMCTLAATGSAGNCLTNFPLIAGVSFLAMAAHLLTDALYPWPVPLLWPLSRAEIGFRIIDWGDPGVLAIMLAAMFGLAVSRGRTRRVAWISLVVFGLYLCTRALLA